jgi:hypothetical protein
MTVWLMLSGCELFESAIPGVAVDVGLLDHPSDATPRPVAPWEITVAAEGGSPFTSTPGSQDLGPLLFLDALARQGGTDGAYSLSVSDLAASGGPFTLAVSLGGGAVLAVEAPTGEPVPPPECAIAVNPQDLDPEVHAADLADCFRAWVDTNGAPSEPTATFTITSRAATVSYSGTLLLEADESVELGCSYDNALPDEVVSNPNSYKIEELRIGGYVGAVDFGMLAWGWVMVYDNADGLQASVVGNFDLGAGTATYVGEEIPVSDPAAAGLSVAGDPVAPLYTPGADWNLTAYTAMLGSEGSPGGADACWGSLHDDVPNRSIVAWSLLGVAKPQL